MYDTIIDLIKNAKRPVFLTGAGVSTNSGIPDYRSSENGIFNSFSIEIFHKDYYEKNKAEVIDFIFNKLNLEKSQPNDIHKWIASYKNATVITQNIDYLHQLAGSKCIDFHGSVDRNSKELNIVFYGDPISEQSFSSAISAIEEADLIIVVGTSLQVTPFADLIHYSELGTKCILINKEDVEGNIFDIKLLEDAINIASYSLGVN